MRRLDSPQGQEWWSRADIRTCSVQITYGGSTPAVRGRLSAGALRLHVDQPPSSIRRGDATAQAREVAEQVVALLRRRTGLGPHPLFTSED
ncbi:hypothetical protein [uncultured Nocardioides sp.]|uniref:hypothetical protein n=1 Tax=uncultured Nocardioides sp. TaxID=198441 RepID=UPI00260E9105|nr:hypothetical protein [uncultured Nocardioides sp.]